MVITRESTRVMAVLLEYLNHRIANVQKKLLRVDIEARDSARSLCGSVGTGTEIVSGYVLQPFFKLIDRQR